VLRAPDEVGIALDQLVKTEEPVHGDWERVLHGKPIEFDEQGGGVFRGLRLPVGSYGGSIRLCGRRVGAVCDLPRTEADWRRCELRL
jgi:hypothetical protein